MASLLKLQQQKIASRLSGRKVLVAGFWKCIYLAIILSFSIKSMAKLKFKGIILYDQKVVDLHTNCE